MTITTRTAKGSQLTIAEMDANLTDLNTKAVKTARSVFTEGVTYTVPDGTSAILAAHTGQIYGITFKFPLNPVADQEVALINATAYSLGDVTLNGNGKTVRGNAVVYMPSMEICTWQYNATDGWVPTYRNKFNTETTAGNLDFVGYAPQGGGYRWNWPGVSCDAYLRAGQWDLQSTNAGLGGRPSSLFYWSESTLDVSDTTANYGRDSWNGFQITCMNSSIPFGVGATNDVPISWNMAAQPNAVSANANIISGVSGTALCMGWKNAPLVFGHQSNGEYARFDTSGNWITKKVNADASNTRNTGSAGFTVPDNVTGVVMAGSGTVLVTFPANPIDGQLLEMSLETAYVAITVAGNGKTLIAGAAIVVTAGSFASWRYRAANTTWRRVG